MRYVFVSDIHGDYTKLQKALKAVSFNAAVDTLVCLGDPFDRGTQNLEVLQFLMSLPNRLFVIGNHEWRLKEILLGHDRFNRYDRMNGLEITLHNFCNNDPIYGPGALILSFKTNRLYHDNYRLLWQYLDECVYGLEWKDLIAVHGWIPTIEVEDRGKILNTFNPYWREASEYEWYEAAWANTPAMLEGNLFPDKKMIIGHWHAADLWARYHGYTIKAKADAPNTTFETDKFIAIDGCTIDDDGVVNTYIYETDEKPIEYRRQKFMQ